jgi:hypothetical protein
MAGERQVEGCVFMVHGTLGLAPGRSPVGIQENNKFVGAHVSQSLVSLAIYLRRVHDGMVSRDLQKGNACRK